MNKKLFILGLGALLTFNAFADEGYNEDMNYASVSSKYETSAADEGTVIGVEEIVFEEQPLDISAKKQKKIDKLIDKYNSDYNKALNKINTIEGDIADEYDLGITSDDTIDSLISEKYAVIAKLEREYIKTNKKIDKIINQ